MSNQSVLELDETYDLQVADSFEIGRSPLCHAILSDTHVSKVHCSLNICGEDAPGSSADSKFKVVISDHSTNGTWISTRGKTTKLEKEKSTVLMEGDVILLTRFTRANHEAVAFKYLSTPFPRIIKCIYKGVGEKPSLCQCEGSNVQIICNRESVATVERAGERDSPDRAVNQSNFRNICANVTFDRSTGSPDAVEYNENYLNVDERKIEATSIKADKTQNESFESRESGEMEAVCTGMKLSPFVASVSSHKSSSKCKGEDDKKRTTMKRKDKADGHFSHPRKVRFKGQTEESLEPQSPYHKDNRSMKNLDSHVKAASNCVIFDSVGGNENCTTFTEKKDASDTDTSTLQVPRGEVKSTTDPTSSSLVMKESDESNIPSFSGSPSEFSKSAKSYKKCNSSLAENVLGKSEKLERSRVRNASTFVDTNEYDKCVHCAKLIPSVTISLHETVCEGHSQEAKSQDYVPLSSLPLESCLLGDESDSDIHSSKKGTTGGDENETNEAREFVEDETERKGKDKGVSEQAEDKTVAKKNLTARRSSLGDFHDILGKSTQREIVGISTVLSCKSGKLEETKTPKKWVMKQDEALEASYKISPSNSQRLLGSCAKSENISTFTASYKSTLTHLEDKLSTEEPASTLGEQSELKESLVDRETVSVSPHQDSPALEKEESKERCTFCSALFPLPDLILHVSTCSETSAVPCTDSSDSESQSEACPYCGKSFDVLDLVEHVQHCKPMLSTATSARDIRPNDLSPSSFVERGSFFDPMGGEDFSMRDKELCPKCHEEFALLEIVNHADKCTGEGLGVGLGSEASRVSANGHFDGSHSDRGLDKIVYKKNFSDDESDSSGDTSKDESGIRYGEGDRDRGSSSSSDSENSFTSSISSKVDESQDEDDSEGEDSGVKHKGSVDVGDDATYGDHDYSHKDVEMSIRESPTKDNDHEHVVAMETSDDDADSDEFEFCPNCRKLFHLSRLIEHASKCTSFVSVKTSLASRCCSGRRISSESSTLTPIAFTNCAHCGKILTVDLLAVHYSECGKPHAGKGERESGEKCSRSEESDPKNISQPFDRIDNLSSRVAVEDERRENRPAISSETSFTLKDSPAPPESEASSLSDDSKEDNEITRESLKRTLSSLDSYQDCQEQCMFCLKMFSVSILVEHVSACASNQAVRDDLEQCCYCYQTFSLSDLITHAESCDQRTAFSSQGDSQYLANSQSASGELVERCMYCFKDFTVSKLILHSQKCDGDMSGPRERFQGFVPSVHDLSAISSVAILNDTQRAALQYVISCSAQDSKKVFSGLLARVQRLGYNENDLTRTLQWVRSAAPIIIHINLDRVLRLLVEDTHYRNQFETGTSGGSTNLAARRSWEDGIFNNSYRHSSPSERVKYGVLNIVGDPRGVRSCITYGDSFLQLKKVRLRTTFASMDTSGAGVKLSCCEHYENVLYSYTDKEITAIMDVATGKVPFHRSDCISHYKEVQIHGPVSLSENVECIVVNARHQGDARIKSLLYRFVEQNECNLIWMDPDDMTGVAPLRFGPAETGFFGSPPRLSGRPIGRDRAVRKRI